MLKIRINKLFGHFDYEFILKDDAINILTGPNGFGKSTVIKCIEAMGKSDIEFFLDTIFEEIEVVNLTTESMITMEKTSDGICINGNFFSKVNLRRMVRGLNIGTSKEEENSETSVQVQNNLKIVMRQMSEMFGTVKLIKEQRLIKDDAEKRYRRSVVIRSQERVSSESIEDIPAKFREIINQVEGNYSRTSNKLDSTFPERLFNQEEGITEVEFQEKLSDMQEKVNKLNRYGISNVQEPGNIHFKQEDARALRVYFDDFQQKYKEYSNFLERLELFNNIVNERFRFKKIETLFSGHFVVIDDETGRRIRLSQLSSGEKEIIVLFFMLLFEVEKNTILLIDEPELSLHIAWQRRFISDLEKIVQLQNLTVVIATHSPQMISGNRELQIDLGELYKNGFNKRKQDEGRYYSGNSDGNK